MSLLHDSYAFHSGVDMPVQYDGVPTMPIVVHRYPQVTGEQHLIGAIHGGDLSCQTTLSGYATEAALMVAIADIMNQAGQLTGTLTQVINGTSINYTRCTFKGAEQIEPSQYDGSGTHGWFTTLRLYWRQRA